MGLWGNCLVFVDRYEASLDPRSYLPMYYCLSPRVIYLLVIVEAVVRDVARHVPVEAGDANLIIENPTPHTQLSSNTASSTIVSTS